MPDDLDGLVEAVTTSIGHLLPWMTWASGYDRDAARGYLEGTRGPWKDRDDFGYALLAEGVIVGSAGLHRRVGPGGLEIGYWVDVRHTRRGIASLATAGLTEAGLGIPGIDRIEIHHDRANTASSGIPVRLGFSKVAERRDKIEAPGESGVEVIWQMTAAAFLESQTEVLLRVARGEGSH
jgi:RimJ/RimL family protein N-acetyltransferase